MNIRDYLEKHLDEIGAVEDIRLRNHHQVVIEYDNEFDLVFITFNEIIRSYRKPPQYKPIATETCTKTALQTDMCGVASPHDLAAREVWNPKSGVDSVQIVYHSIYDSITETRGEWPNRKNVIVSETVYAVPQCVSMCRDNKLHHNYKPAFVQQKNDKVHSIGFYKNGKQCIPPEQKFPSEILVDVTMNQIVRRKNNKPIDLSLRTALKSLYCRVPKTRWSYMHSLREVLKHNHVCRESWQWDDRDIPNEAFEFIQYPLDETDMFTVMMCC